jgi:type I restriction enzyme R subunit
MQATTFWSPDGKPMSAAQFIEQLFGELPELFKSEDELRELWGEPTTRKRLLDGLGDRGYSVEQLSEIAKIVDAEKSDVFDVLAYVAYAKPPITRAQRVADHRGDIHAACNPKQREFLDFVLDHYIEQGVSELDAEKLPQLLALRYQAVADAMRELGAIAEIRSLFVSFQRHLYRRRAS